MGFVVFMLWVLGILEIIASFVSLLALKIRFLWYGTLAFVCIYGAVKLAEAYL